LPVFSAVIEFLNFVLYQISRLISTYSLIFVNNPLVNNIFFDFLFTTRLLIIFFLFFVYNSLVNNIFFDFLLTSGYNCSCLTQNKFTEEFS